jgi:single-strand DNA-binding protein
MSSLNTFTIVGNVTKDVELRKTAKGLATATYFVAVDSSYVDKDNTKHESCDFIPITTYGKQAEADAKFLKRGTPVAVIGTIRSWYKAQDKKGGFNFNAEKVRYLGKSSSGKDTPENAPELNSDMAQWVRDYEAAA